MFLISVCVWFVCVDVGERGCHGEDEGERRTLRSADWCREQPQAQECKAVELLSPIDATIVWPTVGLLAQQ